jgi:hypothetical protein
MDRFVQHEIVERLLDDVQRSAVPEIEPADIVLFRAVVNRIQPEYLPVEIYAPSQVRDDNRRMIVTQSERRPLRLGHQEVGQGQQ